ncbi:hypothetical protein [Pedobacter heparinus]|uniref:hypothetical protein n=1 Tax=Pedobacter heparinus TaxID=984 RepID=UPI002931A119|nr:hypothetical protein [Pedobacter heparinus]
MKYYFVFLTLLVVASNTKAQRPALDTNYRRPYLLVNGIRADPLSLMVLNSDDISEIITLTQTQAAKYGTKYTRFGAVEVTLKDSAEVLSWDKMLKYYHFKPGAARRPVAVHFGLQYDYLNVEHPELLLVSKSSVGRITLGSHLGVPGRMVLSKKVPYVKHPRSSEGVVYVMSNSDFIIDPNPKLEKLHQIFKLEARRRRPL